MDCLYVGINGRQGKIMFSCGGAVLQNHNENIDFSENVNADIEGPGMYPWWFVFVSFYWAPNKKKALLGEKIF